MAALISIALFLFLCGLITAFGYSKYVRPARLLDRLMVAPDETAAGELEKPKDRGSLATRALMAMGKLLPASAGDMKLARRELASAGIRRESAVLVMGGIRILGAAVLIVVAWFGREHVTSNPVMRMVVLLAGGAAGYFLPGLVLGRMTKRRGEKIRFALPDVLDLLVVCSEAGCALDQAMINVSRELAMVHPAICEELTLVNLEILAGSGRSEALRGFAERTGEDEIKKLVAILVQTDRFGTSIAEALRTQSGFLRVRRRQEAEERAGKVGVKLVFPIFFFCMPSLLIVTAGPGLLQLMKNLLPAMRDFK